MAFCCCFKSKSKKDSDSNVELSESVTNSAVTCKCGSVGKNVKVQHDTTTNIYTCTGSGTFLGSCALDCDTAFWQVRVGANPCDVRIGVKRFVSKKSINLDNGLEHEDTDSPAWWYQGDRQLQTGDVVSIYWDQTDLPMVSFAINGEDIHTASITRIRPACDVLPAISVANNASAEVIFDETSFVHPPKSKKFKMIVCAMSVI